MTLSDIEELAIEAENVRLRGDGDGDGDELGGAVSAPVDLWNGMKDHHSSDEEDSQEVSVKLHRRTGKLKEKRAMKAILKERERVKGGEDSLDTTPHLPSTSPSSPTTDPRPPLTFLPGTQTVYIKTYGCSHNRSDSEVMAGLLAREGYNVVLDEDDGRAEADVWLVNSCSVKNPSELAFVKEIAKAKESGKKVVLAGCVAQHSPRDPRWNGLSVVGVQQIDRVVEVVEETIKGNTVQLVRERTEQVEAVEAVAGDDKVNGASSGTPAADPTSPTSTSVSTSVSSSRKKKKAGGAPLDLPKIRRNPLIEIVPINTGCLNECTYCKTKHARGNLGSYPPTAILSRVNQVLSEGVVEIWLTSEDTGAYGLDIGTNIATLLELLLPILQNHPHAMLRVGMTNPPYMLAHLDRIARVLNHPQVYAFLHVPVQSGSDAVLARMKREYTRAEFSYAVDKLLELVPGITIATDVISGFPGESAQDHLETLQLVQRFRFPILHISQFYPRPGTPAARMPDVIPQPIKKERTRELTSLFESFRPYDDLVGREIKRVLVTDKAPDGHKLLGHPKNYTQVLVQPGDDVEMMGRMVDVEIVSAGRWSVEGKFVRFSEGVEVPERVREVVREKEQGRERRKMMAKVTVRKRKVGVVEGKVEEELMEGGKGEVEREGTKKRLDLVWAAGVAVLAMLLAFVCLELL